MSQDFQPLPKEVEKIGKSILNCAFTVHTFLGPELLESVYETCLSTEMRENGLVIENQVALPVIYREQVIEPGFRLDILVNQQIIVEVKAVEQILPIHHAQILTYLKLSNLRLGYIINFNAIHLRKGIKRLVR